MPNPNRTVTIVGIGASAGGIGALQRFFEALPAQPGAAFVVIVHLAPDARSDLAGILAARARMPVSQVTSTTPLKENHVYVIPPDRQLQISDSHISAVPFTDPRGRRAPIDHFFRSLAEQHGDGYAIILTGAGSDGTVGVKAVKEAGGIILVQDPNQAEYPSMPRSAIATEVADFVLPLRQLAERIVELVRVRKLAPGMQRQADDEESLRRILAHVRVRTGHDFSHYKRSTVMRRVLRRMQVARKESLEDYFAHLRESNEESQALLADLLISVTTFFRDPRSFEALAKHAIPHLVRREDPDPIRVWIAGCATGEEAYSIAILLLEEASRHEFRPEIQLFGTDMDARALAIAREGRYPIAIEADVTEERLRRFFICDGEYYRVKRELRDIVLFAGHSLLKDPPFSRLDLVSCRNLLIYLDRDLQQQVLTTLHYGLNPDGYLFLGSSESAEHNDGLFRIVDREARLYQSTGRSHDKLPSLPRLLGVTAAEQGGAAAQPAPLSARGAQSAHRESLELASPPSILVDESYRALHLSDTAGRYLQPSGGPLTTDITDLVRQELRFELRRLLHRVFDSGEQSLSPAVYVRFNGTANRVHMQVRPVRERNVQAQRALIFFVEGEGDMHDDVATAPGEAGEPVDETVNQLKQELELTQSRLRTTHEESEAANEELRAANEELQSINEEYRSTAEELETSKEELQSINEELQTVNSELKLKLDSVSRANSDLQNLIAAMDFGTLFLDTGLCIKRFTPRLADLFNITPTDTGRPITDFTHQLDYDGLPSDAQAVIDHLTPIEREIRSRKGGWYLVRYRPYRTVDDKIDGVVVTFLDVTDRHRMEEALRNSEERLRQETRLVEVSRAPLFVWDFDSGEVLQWNRGSVDLYGFSREGAVGKRTKDQLLHTTVPGSSFEAVRNALSTTGIWKGELHQVAKDGSRLIIEAQLELITMNGKRYVLESSNDVTEAKAMLERQRLLLAELTHRVKNTLTIVQSMAHQTYRNSRSMEEFIQRFEGRISALADSHRLLVDSNWEGADMRALIESQLAGFTSEKPLRVHLEGPLVMLSADTATPFGLILHELATNAAKYGALSIDKGRVALNWQLLQPEGNEPRRVRFTWQENGGPGVKAHPQSGFGTRLIQQGLPGATVKLDYAKNGVQCEMEFPILTGGELRGVGGH